MPCPHRRNALKVLVGELGHAASSRMLEHFRVCGECREAFDFAASTMGRTTGRPQPAESAEGGSAGAASVRIGDRDREPSAAPIVPGPVRRNRRLILVFGVAALGFAVAGLGGGRKGAPGPGEPAPEILWRRQLRDGTPVVQSPAGSFEGRPRVITALLPPGAGAVAVTILDASGAAIHRTEAKPGERGCFVEEGEIPAAGGAFRAGRLLLPFPDESAVPLHDGRPYGIVVSVAGGHASASSVFQVTSAAGALHPAPGETR